ncbi:MAG: secretion system protein E [Candidatus Tectomicrobia bacterium]|uniref:Secretion system protein E n=1 Tax=Tectimicrobiota bacterium TaxID=2528274 RepID=A0A938B5U8_UNCTE|nr:secretion system protein E [Candidatus Tectomicrobia bacterium]
MVRTEQPVAPRTPASAPSGASNNPTAVSSASATSHVLATLLINEGHISAEQLAYARKVQAKMPTPATLIHVLQELQFITADQLRQTLRHNHVSVRLGDLLVELGYLRTADLEAALELQRTSQPKKRLGEVLIEEHFIEARRLAEVLAFQLGFLYVEPHCAELDHELLHQGHGKLYAEHLFLPIGREDKRVIVAFADPLDHHARTAAEGLFGKDLCVAIATKAAMLEALALLARGAAQTTTQALSDNSVVTLVNELFEAAYREQASDIHIEPMKDRLRVRFRCDGVLIPHKEFRKELAPPITSRIKVLARADIAEKLRHQDGRILYENPARGLAIDMRVSCYVTIYGEKVVLRLLSKQAQMLDLAEIGMAPKILERFRHDALETPTGVILVTGPTGSGKTTTLYSCVNALNDIHTCIVTAEEPVEYIIEGIAQCSINPKINVTFDETLRHLMRQDPDIIVLGEIRDRLSAETAIQAALTGHKILTTFHTEDSIGGLLRLLNMDIEAFLISSTVVCVLAQRLLRAVCLNCAEPYIPTPAELQRLGYNALDIKEATGQLGRGCTMCRFTGYQGRIGVFELLILDEMVKDAILARRTSHEIRRISLASSGLVTLLEDGIVKAARGLTSFPEVLHHLPRLTKPRPLRELRRLVGEV